MNDKLIIGIDIDDTMAPYTQKFMEELAREKNVPVETLETPTSYDMWGYEGWGLDTFPDFIAVHNKFVRDGFFSSCGLFPNVAEVIEDLQSKGAYIKIITKRFCSPDPMDKVHVISETAKFLGNNSVVFDEFMIADEKQDIFAHLYLDDSPNNIKKFVNAGREVIVPHSTLHTPETAKSFGVPLMSGGGMGGWATGHEMMLEMMDKFKVALSPKVFA